MKRKHKKLTTAKWIKPNCSKCGWYGVKHKVKSWKCIKCNHIWKV